MVKPTDKTIRPNDASTEQKILAAAREEFIGKGLKGARMQAIADRARVNKALLHYYFRTKEKLYDAVLQNILTTVWSGLRKEFSRKSDGDDIRSLLRQIVTVYINTLAANPDFPRIILREIADGGSRLPALVKSFVDSFGEIPEKINGLLQQEMRRGTIRSVAPIHLALNVLGMCIFTFFAQPILSTASRHGAIRVRFDRQFYGDRIEAIVTMACDGIFKEKAK